TGQLPDVARGSGLSQRSGRVTRLFGDRDYSGGDVHDGANNFHSRRDVQDGAVGQGEGILRGIEDRTIGQVDGGGRSRGGWLRGRVGQFVDLFLNLSIHAIVY